MIDQARQTRQTLRDADVGYQFNQQFRDNLNEVAYSSQDNVEMRS